MLLLAKKRVGKYEKWHDCKQSVRSQGEGKVIENLCGPVHTGIHRLIDSYTDGVRDGTLERAKRHPLFASVQPPLACVCVLLAQPTKIDHTHAPSPSQADCFRYTRVTRLSLSLLLPHRMHHHGGGPRTSHCCGQQ